jgi:hypothetical protein
MDTADIQYPLQKALVAGVGATAVNVVVVTQWLQLISAGAAAVYACIVLVEWGLKKWRKTHGR